MSDTDTIASHRADMALRSRRRFLESRFSKVTWALIGLLGYSAFSNLIAGAIALGKSPGSGAISIALGILYALGVYYVARMDDTPWWPVAVPAGIAIAIIILELLGGAFHLIPLVINIILLVLVPVRKRIFNALNALPRPQPIVPTPPAT